MKKIVVPCVLSVISFCSVFGASLIEEKSKEQFQEQKVDVAAQKEDIAEDIATAEELIGHFTSFIEEHQKDETFSLSDQDELRKRFIALEPAFTAILSASDRVVYEKLKPFILSLDDCDYPNFERFKAACLSPEDYKKVNYIIEHPGYWDFETLGSDFEGSGVDYTKTNGALLALCKLLFPFIDEMARIDGYYKSTLSAIRDDVKIVLKQAAPNKDFSPFFFIEIGVHLRYIESLVYHFHNDGADCRASNNKLKSC